MSLTPSGSGRPQGRRRPRSRAAVWRGAWWGVVPFWLFVTIFLVVPTLVVAIGAFLDADGRPTLANVEALRQGYVVDALMATLELSLVTAVIGAVAGALLSYAVVTARPGGLLRRVVTSACGVLAQFGGVTLAFAFLATIGAQGLITVWLSEHAGVEVPLGLLYSLKGLGLVYSYFQIPLMVIVFLPALEGVRPQWREATESLGGSTWQYWRYVAGPLLLPSFLGSLLLLFANAFAAYATAAALVSQGSPILPLVVRATFTSEVVLGQANFGKALALAMVVVVAIVMSLYAWMQRRTSRWVR